MIGISDYLSSNIMDNVTVNSWSSRNAFLLQSVRLGLGPISIMSSYSPQIAPSGTMAGYRAKRCSVVLTWRSLCVLSNRSFSFTPCYVTYPLPGLAESDDPPFQGLPSDISSPIIFLAQLVKPLSDWPYVSNFASSLLLFHHRALFLANKPSHVEVWYQDGGHLHGCDWWSVWQPFCTGGKTNSVRPRTFFLIT